MIPAGCEIRLELELLPNSFSRSGDARDSCIAAFSQGPGVSREKLLLRVNRCFSAAILPGTP